MLIADQVALASFSAPALKVTLCLYLNLIAKITAGSRSYGIVFPKASGLNAPYAAGPRPMFGL